MNVHELVVFSDLDGTLLDHKTYDFSPALPALQVLKDKGIPLILASSKTGAEISQLRSLLDLQQWPAIVENGAGELPAGNLSENNHSDYHQIRSILEKLSPALRQLYRGFGDMHEDELADITGLTLESARLARQRAYTEPGIFTGSSADKELFVSALAHHGVTVQEGGRFQTLSFGRTKAEGLRLIANRMHATATIALGDAPNDREMLMAATHAIVVRNDHGADIGEVPGAIHTDAMGPAGWNEALLGLLDTLT